MTWKVFVKGVSMLGVKKMEIAITMRTMDGRETVVTSAVEFFQEVVNKDLKMKYSDHVLPELVAGIMRNLQIDGEGINKYLNQYYVRSCASGESFTMHALKNSFMKDLRGESMTWKSFMKILLIFEIAIFDIDIQLTHRLKGVQTTHGRKVAIDQNYNP